MGGWFWFLFTAGVIGAAVAGFFVVRFFRRLYFVIEEVDARLVQLRNLLEKGNIGNSK